MNREGIDSVLFTSLHNINFFNHFLYTALGSNFGFAVSPDRIRTITANIHGVQGWLSGAGENFVYTYWQRDNFSSTDRKEFFGSKVI